MNRIIEKEKDFSSVNNCLGEARRIIKDEILSPGRHYLYFKAPLNNDLVVIDINGKKPRLRKADIKEWNEYFYEFINIKEKRCKTKRKN